MQNAVLARRSTNAITLRQIAIFYTVFAATLYAAEPDAKPDRAGYEKSIEPFLTKYCQKCHDGDKPRGEFSVDVRRLTIDFGNPGIREKWRELINVLNSHQMPPEEEVQPSVDEVASVVDWITDQAVRAELIRRERSVVLRRLNRHEYRNSIRDLVGVDFDTSGFPQDPPAGGFDNNGLALTISPLHMELYLLATNQILDRAIVAGDRPSVIRWKFEPRIGDVDSRRIRLDDNNNPIINGGMNQQEASWVVVHHNSWDKVVEARDFRVPVAGTYVIRLHAAGRIPTREQVVESAEKLLRKQRAEQDAQNPQNKAGHQQHYENQLKHFATDRMYDYGPPRVKLVQQLGPQPRVIAEFDANGSVKSPVTHEFLVRFTTESAGIRFEYAYEIPNVLENFWMQRNDAFARPELMVDWFEIEGPLYDAWPPSSHTRIFFPDKSIHDEKLYAHEILARFMKRAFRRPVHQDEIHDKLRLYELARTEKSFLEAMKSSLTAILTSSNFLYLVESNPPTDSESRKPARLGDFEIASRLSYLLWSSMPDERLFQLAEKGALKSARAREDEIDRMLADKKAEAFVHNFTGQWLNLREVGANPPASDLYPQYDRHLETSIVRESEAYFREFLITDLDVRKMIRSDFVVINERLARFYGIPDVRGDDFQRVTVPSGVERGGIVTQASILTITSNGTRTSPVKRGTWILKTLLGIDPGLPLANAGEIAPKVPGLDKATVRQRLEIHRSLPQCARCHKKIDPLGFALENYNAAGEWRLQEGFGYKGRIEPDDPLIDASSVMPDGTRIVGVAGLQQEMLAKEDLFLNSLTSKLMTYAYGRELGLADAPSIKNAVETMKKNGYTLRSLLKSVVASDDFVTK